MRNCGLLKNYKKLNTPDYIALIITSTICLVILIIMIGVTIRGEPISEEGLDIIGRVLFALVAIVSLYIGASLKKK